MSEDALFTALHAFDGKSVEPLKSCLAEDGLGAGDIPRLIEACAAPSEKHQVGATWLLKAYLEQGRTVTAAEAAAFVGTLAGLSHWEARLHACQLLRHLEVAAADLAAVTDFLGAEIAAQKPFLRAWACDALVHLSDRHPSLRQSAGAALAAAEADPAASVRARARQLRKARPAL